MRCVIYVRLSVSNEQSVSIARQIKSCRAYADARGWEVVADPFVDDGVSASKNKPAQRAGWSALIASRESFDRVIIWKLDRLARRVLDFHLANSDLEERGAALVAVENSIDMGTPDGRLVANVLASFAEYEAAAISARVRAARSYLVNDGRAVGGTVPYGWQNVPNPSGSGMILAQHPERITYVREMVERTLAGRSIYGTARLMEEYGVRPPAAGDLIGPLPRGGYDWHHSTVERLLRHPVLAGMTPFNPGNDSKRRGADVLRGPDGLPIVNEAVAVMPVARWRAMVARLDEPQTGRSTPRALRAQTSGVLSGLVFCGEHDEPVRMYRGTVQGRPGYYCPECHHSITNFEDLVVEDFLAATNERARFTVMEEVMDGPAALLPEIEQRLTELGQEIANERDRDARLALLDQIDALQELKAEALAAPGEVRYESEPAVFFSEAWAAAEDDEQRRAVIGDALVSVTVRRGSRGRQNAAQKRARLAYAWQPGLGL